MEKTKEDILNPIMPIILSSTFTREEKKDFILKAMQEYRNQGRNFTEIEIEDIKEHAFEAGYKTRLETKSGNDI